MPIHFNDLDVVSEVAGLNSVLIVPCNMCPAVTVAVREKKPFMQERSIFRKSGSARSPTKMVGTPGRNVGLYFLMISIFILGSGLGTKIFSHACHMIMFCMEAKPAV